MPNEMVEQKVIQVSFWKAATIVSGAILVSIVGTAFTVASVINSDHFLLANTVEEVDRLKDSKMDASIANLKFDQIITELTEIKEILREDQRDARQSAQPQSIQIAQTPDPTPQPTPRPIVIEQRTEVREEPEKEPEEDTPGNSPETPPGQEQRETVLDRVLGVL